MNPIHVIDTIDMHCEGEAGRVLPSAHLFVRGRTMSERFDYAKSHLEWLRRLVLSEPRGRPSQCAALIVPPDNPGSDFGLIVMNAAGFSPMSGSNSICATTALLQNGTITTSEPTTPVVIDTAVGTVKAEATVRDGRVGQVAVHAPSSFATDLDVVLDVPEFGPIAVDVAFGGQFVVQARARDLDVDLSTSSPGQIARAGAMLKVAATRQLQVKHPLNPAIDYIGLVMLFEDGDATGADCRNAVIITNPDPTRPSTWTGTLDRSPCGNGTCARLAVLHARSRIEVGEPFVNQGVLGTTFTASIRSTTRVANYDAIEPVVAGRAWTVARSQLILDRDDPFPEGFTLRD